MQATITNGLPRHSVRFNRHQTDQKYKGQINVSTIIKVSSALLRTANPDTCKVSQQQSPMCQGKNRSNNKSTGLAVRSKADETFVIVETLICLLQISHLTHN